MEAKTDAPLADFFGTLCAIFAKSASYENWAVARMIWTSQVSQATAHIFQVLKLFIYLSHTFMYVYLLSASHGSLDFLKLLMQE